MAYLFASSLRSTAATAGLLLGLAACADLLLPAPSLAGQAPSLCQKGAAAATPVAGAGIQAAPLLNGPLLAQALPTAQSQPIGAELGEPACTYDPAVPTKSQIIRGLW